VNINRADDPAKGLHDLIFDLRYHLTTFDAVS
jgi:hypothetical protein